MILTKVNFVSKILQSIDMNMQVALDALTELKKFLIKIRTDTIFEEIVNDAMKIGKKLDMEAEFVTSRSRPLRRRKTPKSFDYEHEDHTINDPKTAFLRILLTMPVTVASAERSFSKLKLIKNYLRSTMSQERLTNLATISIEEAILDHSDIHEMIKDFAIRKARRVEII